MSPSDRPMFTDDQLAEYFDCIKLPENAQQNLRSKDPSEQLEAVNTLIRYQLSHIPFENLDLHYAPVKGVSLNIGHLYHKVIERKCGRGGYCMQNNSFFATVLRSLGYVIMTAGARVASAFDTGVPGQSEPPEITFGTFSHQVNIITIGGKRYMVDVGFGSQGPTSLIPLENGYEVLHTGVKGRVGASSKLTRGFTAANTSRNPEQEVWLYNIKFGDIPDDAKAWSTVYCFSETEFLPEDFEMSNLWVSTKSELFVNRIVCTRFLLAEDGKTLIGDITLMERAIKTRKFGVSEVVAEFSSEEERVEGLEKYLGVKLSKGEREGIKGHVSAIR